MQLSANDITQALTSGANVRVSTDAVSATELLDMVSAAARAGGTLTVVEVEDMDKALFLQLAALGGAHVVFDFASPAR